MKIQTEKSEKYFVKKWRVTFRFLEGIHGLECYAPDEDKAAVWACHLITPKDKSYLETLKHVEEITEIK